MKIGKGHLEMEGRWEREIKNSRDIYLYTLTPQDEYKIS